MIYTFFTHALLDFAYIVIKEYKLDVPVVPEWYLAGLSEETLSEIHDISKTLYYFMQGSLVESGACYDYILEYCPGEFRNELVDLMFEYNRTKKHMTIDENDYEARIDIKRLLYLLNKIAYNFMCYLKVEKMNNERVKRAFGVLDYNRNDNNRAYVYNCDDGGWSKDVKEGFTEPEVDTGTSTFYAEKYGANATYLCSEVSEMSLCIDRPGFSRTLEKMKSDRPRFLIVPRLDHVIASDIHGVLLCETLLNSIGVELVVAKNQYLYLKNTELSVNK